jgi:hypothetical protein
MVVRVKLEGLNIVKARGRWYVYPRGGGDPILRGFEGSRADVEKKLAEPDMMATYNRPRLLRRRAADFPFEALGGFVHWFTCGAIDDSKAGEVDGYPKWWKLAPSTRDDYLEAFDYLRPEFDVILKDITQPELYEVRDQCANKKWPRFADQMIAALSSMFRQAVKRGKMPFNPCLGMDKAHTADPNSNREWFAPELAFVRANAPLEVLIPCMIARYAGLAGQTIVGLTDRQFFDDLKGPTGKLVQYTRRKNGKATLLPVLPELQEFMASRDLRRADGLIAIRDDGSPWASEKEMQTRVSHWLRDRERDGKIGAGTTLHGLRVSYAAWWKRNGASDEEVARLIGDKSVKMGAHYTRHVEDEVSIVRAFGRLKDKS